MVAPLGASRLATGPLPENACSLAYDDIHMFRPSRTSQSPGSDYDRAVRGYAEQHDVCRHGYC